jgi:hypothetical protein
MFCPWCGAEVEPDDSKFTLVEFARQIIEADPNAQYRMMREWTENENG